MRDMLIEKLTVYYGGQAGELVSEDKLMLGFKARPGTGCYEAGRENHKMLRYDKYLTFCICEDCNWEF
jgi:hypothetical protein